MALAGAVLQKLAALEDECPLVLYTTHFFDLIAHNMVPESRKLAYQVRLYGVFILKLRTCLQRAFRRFRGKHMAFVAADDAGADAGAGAGAGAAPAGTTSLEQERGVTLLFQVRGTTSGHAGRRRARWLSKLTAKPRTVPAAGAAGPGAERVRAADGRRRRH